MYGGINRVTAVSELCADRPSRAARGADMGAGELGLIEGMGEDPPCVEPTGEHQRRRACSQSVTWY